MTRLDVPQFFGLLTAALAIAKVFGSLAKWISQPAVLGEWSAEFSHSCVPLLFTNDRESFDAVVMLLVELSQLRRRPLYVEFFFLREQVANMHRKDSREA